ncbi:MAG: hypothetical protein B6D56_07160 [Candidatus Omnitrophica bacterium 4484_70.1]|nr:MAG: hypothetical protein B6D56_07160 [Candidatus Omnitrophica bacterium 4484_70.1]
MLGYLILIFMLVPFIELAILIKAGQHIGVGWTLFLVIFTGVSGACLAKQQGTLILRKILQEINSGRMPSEELLEGILILCGGILLLTPGFITDIVGFMCVFPITRDLIKQGIKRRIRKMILEENSIDFTFFKDRFF